MFYCIGVIGYSLQQLLNRGFYAIRDTKTAVAVNVIIILVNVVLSFIFVQFMAAQGLALAYSVAGLLSAVLLYLLLRAKVGPLGGRRIVSSFMKISFASALMGGAVHMSLRWMETWLDLNNKWHQLFELGAAVVIGIVVYGTVVVLLRLPESQDLIERIKGRRKRAA